MSAVSALYGNTNPFNRISSALRVNGSHVELPPRDLYDILEKYYANNSLYDDLGIWMLENNQLPEGLKGLRNPAFRVVEFYPSTLWPGDLRKSLPILCENAAIKDPIKKVWGWSNFQVKKQLLARWFALFGDMFIKVVERGNGPLSLERVSDPNSQRIYFQILDPRTVTKFDSDERGYLTTCRIDIVLERNSAGKVMVQTEYWEKDRFRLWVHELSVNVPLEKLGRPEVDRTNELGFVPIVWSPFRDIGKSRGVGAFTLEIDKIDEVNRMATRLHRMLFRHNKPVWALEANMMDNSGRPLPAPRIINSGSGSVLGGVEQSTLTLGDDALIRLPGMSKLSTMIPNIQYDSALKILEAHTVELERDMPELRYSRMMDFSQVTGPAVRYMLSDAIDRAIEARGNGESAIIRANQIALTMGAKAGIKGFDVGTFENGDFDHTFKTRPVLPPNELELAQTASTWKGAGMPITTFLKREGWTDEEIEDFAADRQAEADEQMKQQEAQLTMQAKLAPKPAPGQPQP